MTAYDLSARIRRILSLDPDATFLQAGGSWSTWGETTRLAERLQEELAAAGVAEGAAIGLVMRNRPGVVVAILSILMNRQTVVTISSMTPDEKLASEVATLPVAVVVGYTQDWEREGVRAAARESGALALSISDHDLTVLEPLRRQDAAELVQPGTAVLMLTSGTTGPPKRVPLSYGAFNEGYAALGHYERSGDDVRLRGGTAVLFVPLLHVSGIFNLLLTVLQGRRVALMERFAVDEWLSLVEEHRPPSLSLLPTALKMVMAADIDPARLSFAKSVIVGTAPLSAEDALAWEDRFGIPVLIVYGATEFAGGIAGWTISDHREFAATKRGSVGRAHPGVDMRTADPDSGEPLPAGEVGLLEVRAPQLGDRGAEWVRTSDLARVDDDGFLWILGRADDVIIRGGFKISTGTVAETLKRHAAVRDAGVVGIADERLGEVPVAAVEIEPGHHVDEASLLSFLRESLASYQIPVTIHVVDELPRTPSMKVSTPGLKDLIRTLESQGTPA